MCQTVANTGHSTGKITREDVARRPISRAAISGLMPGDGLYRVERLMAEHGDAKLTDLLRTPADCAKVCSVSIHDEGL